MKKPSVTVLILISAIGVLSRADEASEKREAIVEKREKIQQQRIEQGVHSGELKPGEAARLKRQEARIEKAEEKAMADGNMSKDEFRKIQKMQNKENRKIFRKKHNENHD